ncbi:MAG: hypothetical protein OEX21_02645, partial [Betaproteobacteria bacterium]|nr:hypothetical protein [Betaproteobacteria bacterium]
LIVYLLDDFYRELEPIGRLDIVGDLSKRALNYYDALPPELRTKDTDRNRALALVRQGAVARNLARSDEGEKALTEALRILEALREGGDKQEITAVGYALGLTFQAKIKGDRGKNAESMALAQKAPEVLEPLAKAPGSSVTVRRTYAYVNLYLGFGQLRTNQPELAVKTLEASREAYRSIDDLKLTDLSAATGYAESTAWQMGALLDLQRFAEVRERGEEGIRIASEVLARSPGHKLALRALALTRSTMADLEANVLNTRKAAMDSLASARDWENYLRLDPGDSIGWNNLGASGIRTADSLMDLGRESEALTQYRAILAIETKAKGKFQAFSHGGLAYAASNIAAIQVQRGEMREAQASLAEARRLANITAQAYRAGSWDRITAEEFPRILEAYVGEAAGDYSVAREKMLAVATRLQSFKTTSALEKRQEAETLERLNRDLARWSFLLKDFAATEAYSRQSIDFRKREPARSPRDATYSSEAPILLATALARQGRLVDARQQLDPVLKLHRELRSRGSDNLVQHVLMAGALYAAALASPADAPARLAEAAAIIDAFPAEMKRRRTVSAVRELIAQEMKRR